MVVRWPIGVTTPQVDLMVGRSTPLAMDGSSEPVQLTNRKAGSDADPAWSPDGTMIAFRRRGSNDNFDVYVMRSDGSGVRPVATGPAVDEKPAWSPDGRQLMIISNRDASGKPDQDLRRLHRGSRRWRSRTARADRQRRSYARLVVSLKLPPRCRNCAELSRVRAPGAWSSRLRGSGCAGRLPVLRTGSR